MTYSAAFLWNINILYFYISLLYEKPKLVIKRANYFYLSEHHPDDLFVVVVALGILVADTVTVAVAVAVVEAPHNTEFRLAVPWTVIFFTKGVSASTISLFLSFLISRFYLYLDIP